MQAEVLPAAPLTMPGSVKVARRLLSRSVLVRVQPGSHFGGRQADISWLHLSRKQGP